MGLVCVGGFIYGGKGVGGSDMGMVGGKRGGALYSKINWEKRYIPSCHVQSPLWLLETSYCSSQLSQMANLPLYLFFPVLSSPSLVDIGLSVEVLLLATTLDDGFFGI